MYQTEAMVSLTRYHHGSSDRSNYYPIHLKGRMRGQQLKVVSQYDGASLPETRELLCPNLFLKLISSSFYHFAVFLQYNRYFPWFFNDLGFQKYRVFVQGKGGRKSNACSLRFHAPHTPPPQFCRIAGNRQNSGFERFYAFKVQYHYNHLKSRL